MGAKQSRPFLRHAWRRLRRSQQHRLHDPSAPARNQRLTDTDRSGSASTSERRRRHQRRRSRPAQAGPWPLCRPSTKGLLPARHLVCI